jgi:hypothetical protein
MLETIPSPSLACSPLGKWKIQLTDGPGEQTKQRAQYYYDCNTADGNYSQKRVGTAGGGGFRG